MNNFFRSDKEQQEPSLIKNIQHKIIRPTCSGVLVKHFLSKRYQTKMSEENNFVEKMSM